MAPIIVIVTPILLPVLNTIGLSPIQFGVMPILNCGIGLLTPPVGGVLFVGSGISGISIEKLTKHTLPFIVVMLVILIMISFIPELSLGIPRMLGLVR